MNLEDRGTMNNKNYKDVNNKVIYEFYDKEEFGTLL